MKPVTSYKSFDGSVFGTAKECADYETHCGAISKIVDKLPRFIRDDDFEKGVSYYQHDWKSFVDVRTEFCMYMDSIHSNFVFRQQIGERVLLMDTNWYFRFFRNTNDYPALLAWYYIGCVDSQYRQWSHPDFIKDTPEGAKCINKESLL